MSESQEEQYARPGSRSRFALVDFVRQSRAFVLLSALLFQILLSGPDIGGRLFDVLVKVGTVVAAIYMTADSKRHLVIGMFLGIPSLVLVIFSSRIDHGLLDWSTFAVVLCLYLFIIRLMLVQIFSAKVITINIIGLALCTYILIGAVWVLFYTPVVAMDPNAFSIPIRNEGDAFHTMTYFSYVTLTTLGYGDISPVSNLARNLAVLEAVTGTLFLAVLISRLVGSYVSRRNQ